MTKLEGRASLPDLGSSFLHWSRMRMRVVSCSVQKKGPPEVTSERSGPGGQEPGALWAWTLVCPAVPRAPLHLLWSHVSRLVSSQTGTY